MIEKSVAGTASPEDLGYEGGRNLNWPSGDRAGSPVTRESFTVRRLSFHVAGRGCRGDYHGGRDLAPLQKPFRRQSSKDPRSSAFSSNVSIRQRLRVGCEQVRLLKIFRRIDIEERIHGGDVPLDNGDAVVRGEGIDFSDAVGQGLLKIGKN